MPNDSGNNASSSVKSPTVASPFGTQITMLTVASVDDSNLQVSAQYNPKEIGIDKNINWTKHQGAKMDSADLEYTGADGRALSLELFFDGYEDNTDVDATYVSKLLTMATASTDKNAKPQGRPHQVIVVWGTTMKPFTGVIASLSTKYSMFAPDGTPIRATVTLKLTEATSAARGADPSTTPAAGTTGQ